MRAPMLVVLLTLATGCNEPEVIRIGFDDLTGGGADDVDVQPGPPDTNPRYNCQPNALVGCVSAYSRKVCDEDGLTFEDKACPAGHICVLDGQCKPAKCVPGEETCVSPDKVGVCADDGSGYSVTEVCDTGLSCVEGVCRSSCISAVKAQTNVGCNYALVDLGNFESEPQGAESDHPVVVVVSNTSGIEDAHIEIISNNPNAAPLEFTEEELTVPPQQLKTLTLPVGSAQLETSINRGSWTLTSDQPVTVHLINPENGPDVRSNDATLLFPTDSLGKNYIFMGWKSFWTEAQGFDEQGFPKYGFPSYLTVIATASGKTEVTITPSANIKAGQAPGGPIVDAVKAGTTVSYSLNHGDVLNYALEPQVAQVDLTGTQVTSDKPIAVLMAHNCAFVPSIDVKFCDHLEHQLAPVDTWGKGYVADLFAPRAPDAYDVWRIMASQDETVITTDPAVPEVAGIILNKGEWVEYQASFAHVIEATRPIQVGHFMTGSNIPGFDPVCGDNLTGIGDPAFTIGVAVNQYLDSYVVLTPPGYTDDWINVVRLIGTKITLDGNPLGGTVTPIGGSVYELVRVAVGDGVHRLDADEPFGVTAYGYDCDVSYAYPGGMLLKAGPGN